MCIFHDWSMWSEVIPSFNGENHHQWKYCKRCNKITHNNLSWLTPAARINEAISKIKTEDELPDEGGKL